MGRITAVALTLALMLPAAGQEPKPAPPPPLVSILLKDRHGHAVPGRSGCAHTGGGTIDVQQPSPDTIVITLTGAAVATDHPCGSTATMAFELAQAFEIAFDKPGVLSAKATVEARVIGLLRGGRTGAASEAGGCATVTGGATELLTVGLPGRGVACGESLSVNDKAGPAAASVKSGPYVLHAGWQVSVTHPKALLGRAASAEFAPDPALDPLWVGGPKEPFRGANKKDFGFQITLRVVEDAPVSALPGGRPVW